MGGHGLVSSGPGQGEVPHCDEHGNETSGSVKCGESCDLPWR